MLRPLTRQLSTIEMPTAKVFWMLSAYLGAEGAAGVGGAAGAESAAGAEGAEGAGWADALERHRHRDAPERVEGDGEPDDPAEADQEVALVQRLVVIEHHADGGDGRAEEAKLHRLRWG